jgi:hypothetical protein
MTGSARRQFVQQAGSGPDRRGLASAHRRGAAFAWMNRIDAHDTEPATPTSTEGSAR